jgi:hypothetical protein
MEIRINGEPKEIADLALELQNRLTEEVADVATKYYQSAENFEISLPHED